MSIVVIDNDECVGSWVDMSVLHMLYQRVLKQTPPVDLFVKIINATGAVRAHLRQLYDTVLDLKVRGLVSKVYMCTAARNTGGWVSFLRELLEAWYGRKVYDHMFDGVNIADWHKRTGTMGTDLFGNVYKDMNMIRKHAGVSGDHHVVVIDDRPYLARNADRIGVPPYRVAVNLEQVCTKFLPFWATTWIHRDPCNRAVLQKTWNDFLDHPTSFTVVALDDGLAVAAEQLVTMVR
jgi:hypothetical protein